MIFKKSKFLCDFNSKLLGYEFTVTMLQRPFQVKDFETHYIVFSHVSLVLLECDYYPNKLSQILSIG